MRSDIRGIHPVKSGALAVPEPAGVRVRCCTLPDLAGVLLVVPVERALPELADALVKSLALLELDNELVECCTLMLEDEPEECCDDVGTCWEAADEACSEILVA